MGPGCGSDEGPQPGGGPSGSSGSSTSTSSGPSATTGSSTATTGSGSGTAGSSGSTGAGAGGSTGSGGAGSSGAAGADGSGGAGGAGGSSGAGGSAGSAGSSGCAYQSDSQFCACIGKNCGGDTIADSAGGYHSVYCGACAAGQYCSATPSVNGGAVGSCQNGGALTSAQKQKAEMLTSIWENDTPTIDYTYSENIRDNRGYTSGRAGFCTGTGDAIIVVECYDLAKPGNVMQKYMPALVKIQAKFVASGGTVLQGSTADLDAIGSYTKDWGTAAGDAVFRACQDYVVDAVYYGVAMKHVASKKFTTALTRAALYDAQINQGETDPKFGVVKMMSMADAQAGALGNPPTIADEDKWLAAFLYVRATIMKNDSTWRTNTYRCANYEKLRLAKNWDLGACILTNAQSSTYWSGYPSGSSSVFKIVTDPTDPNKARATSGGSCP